MGLNFFWGLDFRSGKYSHLRLKWGASWVNQVQSRLLRNCGWSVAVWLRTAEFVYRWCLHCTEWSLLYSTSRIRITAARTMPKQNIKSGGKMSCRRTLVKVSALPLHFGFWRNQYLCSRSVIPLSFNHLTLKQEEMLSDHLDSTVSCQYSHNCTVMVCQLLYYDAVLTQARHYFATGP